MGAMTQYLTVEDVAAMIRSTPQAVRYRRHRGTGPRSFKVGRRVLFDPADVSEWIEQQKAAS